MWIALLLLATFIGYCWYDSLSSSFPEGSEWLNAPDDEDTALAGLREMLDKPLKSSPERDLAGPEIGFMTSVNTVPFSGEDWERAP